MTDNIAPLCAAQSIYGLGVSSDLSLPELRPVLDTSRDGAADIVIREGEVAPAYTSEISEWRHYIDGHPDFLWLNIPNAIRMEIRSGNNIVYHRYPGVDDDEVRLFLLGSGLGAILMQRGFAVIHGNAVVPRGQQGAIICIGDSGAGKSTAAVGMMQRGLAILADDVCPIGSDGNVLSGMARAKLWEATAHQLGIDTSKLSRIRSIDAKYNLPLDSAHCTQPQPVRGFYWLVPDEVERVTIEPVLGTERFAVLRKNVYRPEFLKPLGLEIDAMRQLAKIATSAPVFKVLRPKNGFDIDGLLDAILANDDQYSRQRRSAGLFSPTMKDIQA
jgi:hypothetical protein